VYASLAAIAPPNSRQDRAEGKYLKTRRLEPSTASTFYRLVRSRVEIQSGSLIFSTLGAGFRDTGFPVPQQVALQTKKESRRSWDGGSQGATSTATGFGVRRDELKTFGLVTGAITERA